MSEAARYWREFPNSSPEAKTALAALLREQHRLRDALLAAGAERAKGWAEAVKVLNEPPLDESGRSRRRAKSSPALERARGTIKELFSGVVPEQSVLPNANLLRQVGEKLRQAALPAVSDDTILRAAGRRK